MYTKLVDGEVREVRLGMEDYDEIRANEDAIDEYLDAQSKLDGASDTYEKDFMEYQEAINECFERINEIVENCDVV